MDKQNAIEVITEFCKKNKFSKNKLTWYKNLKDVTLVLNIQISQWDKNDYYINIGVFINKLHLNTQINIMYADLSDRIDITNDIVFEIEKWFDKYDSMQKLIESYNNKTLPEDRMMEAVEFLSKF